MSWRRFLLIPVWLLTLAVIPRLPAKHPWRDRNMTLDGWERAATDNAVMFGFVFWVHGLTILVLIIRLMTLP